MLRTLRAVTPRNFNPLRNANGARQGTVETPVRRQTGQGARQLKATDLQARLPTGLTRVILPLNALML